MTRNVACALQPRTGAIEPISVVAPVYDEGPIIQEFHRRLAAVMRDVGAVWEVVYVNDGSTDDSLEQLLAMAHVDSHVTVVNLSRNFGKEIATTAGLDHSRGGIVVVIDADLQDPPELIPELLAAWRKGYDVAFAQRRSRAGETWLKTTTAGLFYRIMGRIAPFTLPPDTGDFRLMSRRVVDAVLSMREHHRFMRGLFAWVGFPWTPVPYDRAPRHSGITKWNYWKLIELAIEAITSFSVFPLKIATIFGMVIALVAIIYSIFIVIHTIVVGNDVPGYPSLLIVLLLLGSAQLITLGIVGEYLGRVLNEARRRPLYFVERVVGGTAVADQAPIRPSVPTDGTAQPPF